MHSRLLIVEGLPCSGKSTTARFIADTLSERGYPVRHLAEGNLEHPADYEYSACVMADDLAAFTAEERRAIAAVGEATGAGLVVPLARLDEALAARLTPFRIYGGLPWARERPVMLDRWAAFARQAAAGDDVYVFECCFLQNPLCETMMRFNLPYDAIRRYVEDIYRRITALDPVVVYLRFSGVGARVAAVARERDPRWLESVVRYHTTQGYGAANGLVGYDGYIACLEKRQEMELAVLADLGIERLVLRDPFVDWDGAHREIADYLNSRH